MRTRFRLPVALSLLVALVSAGMFVAGQSQAADAVAPPTLGIAVDDGLVTLARDNPAALDDYFAKASATGTQWIRFQYEFNQIEPSRNQFVWTRWDALTIKANSHGLKVLGILMGTPQWAVPASCSPYYWLCMPDATDFGAFAGAVAGHYDGNHGAGRVDAWEIWNEPNCSKAHPNSPADYTNIVKAAYGPIKAASGVTVLAGGSMPCKTDSATPVYSPRDWLVAMYENGAHGYFDGLAHHPYCWVGTKLADSQFCPLQEEAWSTWSLMYKDFKNNNGYSTDGRSLRTIMAANGDASLPIWLTEFGAPTAQQPYLSEADQDRQLKDSYSWLENQAPGLYGPMFWYELQDRCSPDGLSGNQCGDTEGYFGLLDYNGRPKLAHHTFRALNAAAEPTPSPSTSDAPATVSVSSLVPTGTFRSSDVVSVGFTLNTSAPIAVDSLIIAVRDSDGSNYDFPSQPATTLNSRQSFRTGRKLPAGTYRCWVAYHTDSGWTDVLPERSISIRQ